MKKNRYSVKVFATNTMTTVAKENGPMKKCLIFISFIVTVVFLPYISCKTEPPVTPKQDEQAPVQQEQQSETPPPTPTPPTTPAPSQALLESLSAAATKAEEARKRAADFEGNSYFPSEWEAAEEQYTQAGNLSKDNQTDIEKAITEYNSSVDAFNSIFELALPLYAQAREDEILAIRTSLVTGGAKDSFPEYFTPADEMALSALAQYENADYYSAKNTAAKALLMYRTLEAAFYTWHLWGEINERDFIFYDPDNYNRAGEIISDAMDAYLEKDFSAAMESIKEAETRYSAVLETGWVSFAELRHSLAESERLAALDIKANVSAKDYFDEAEQSFQSALEYQNTEKYEEAAKQFIHAETMYIIASMSVTERRRKAAAAILDANEKIEKSNEAARQAAKIIYGGIE
jgi:hypothetical protein